jgi:hypothetical protein
MERFERFCELSERLSKLMEEHRASLSIKDMQEIGREIYLISQEIGDMFKAYKDETQFENLEF